jgi:hypothetical protein
LSALASDDAQFVKILEVRDRVWAVHERANLTYDRIKRSFLVLEVVVMKVMSMSEILARILGGIIFSISIVDIIFSTDFHFVYQ